MKNRILAMVICCLIVSLNEVEAGSGKALNYLAQTMKLMKNKSLSLGHRKFMNELFTDPVEFFSNYGMREWGIRRLKNTKFKDEDLLLIAKANAEGRVLPLRKGMKKSLCASVKNNLSSKRVELEKPNSILTKANEIEIYKSKNYKNGNKVKTDASVLSEYDLLREAMYAIGDMLAFQVAFQSLGCAGEMNPNNILADSTYAINQFQALFRRSNTYAKNFGPQWLQATKSAK